jgi:hypothetical protein
MEWGYQSTTSSLASHLKKKDDMRIQLIHTRVCSVLEVNKIFRRPV